jgi:hypothetical protein
MNLIRVKINVSRILKEHLFEGKNGKYLDLTLLPCKDGQDKYQNDYSVVQDLGKEARQRGEKGPFIGSAKILQSRSGSAPTQQTTNGNQNEGDSVPF